MGMFNEWGNTLKDLADKLFGGPEKKPWHGLYPGDVGYIQATFDIPIKEGNVPVRQPVSSACKRWDEKQRAGKLARKGHRRYKRARIEGPNAR